MRGGNALTALVGMAWVTAFVIRAVGLTQSWAKLLELLAMDCRGHNTALME